MQQEKTKTILAILIFFALVGCIAGLYLRELPPGARDILLVLIGVVAALVKDVYGYYFGSSDGSQRKTELLGGIANETKPADTVGAGPVGQ